MSSHIVKIAKDEITTQRIIQLRYEVLRKPWQKPIDTASDELEQTSINAYIEQDGDIIACGRLQNNGQGTGQIRFMAVSETQQGKGLGKLILQKLEQEAQQIGLTRIELQARQNAVKFYEANGYTIKEKSFVLWDIIQHYLMFKMVN